MSSEHTDTLARPAQAESCLPALLDLPGEIRNGIYEYTFSVDHIQGIQYQAPSAGKTNNKYYTFTSGYNMTFETRDSATGAPCHNNSAPCLLSSKLVARLAPRLRVSPSP
jgi:hypothetical protein